MRYTTATVVVAGVAIVSLVAAVTFLTYHGSVNGQAAMTFLSGISTACLAVFAVSHGGTNTAKNIARATGKPVGEEKV